MNRRTRFVAALSAIIGLIGILVAAVPASAANGAAVPDINNTNRAQVAASYRSAIEANMNLSPGWTGSTRGCAAGTSTATYDAATVEAINWFRSMAGLNPVVEDAQQSAAAQRAALMMHAQQTLSHYPSPDWNCYSQAGATTAGLSNLTYNITGPRSILGQIEDAGAANVALGHRRWLLFPELTTVGVGNTSTASVVQVINDFGARVSETDWVSWPPPGFVPDEMVYPRWSMSFAGSETINLSNASVTVTENGSPLRVTMLPVINGFGDPALGWEVAGANPTQPGDVKYEVVVNGLVIDGRSAIRRYTVTAFDASAPAGPSCNGLQATIVGTANDDRLVGTDGVDVIVGLGGDDVIDGLAGNDIICGGAGDDTIRSGWGNDKAYGGAGQDVLRGARGSDLLHGGAGRDRLDGGMGADTLIGGDHIDTLIGAGGTDTCWGRAIRQQVDTNDSRTCERGR